MGCQSHFLPSCPCPAMQRATYPRISCPINPAGSATVVENWRGLLSHYAISVVGAFWGHHLLPEPPLSSEPQVTWPPGSHSPALSCDWLMGGESLDCFITLPVSWPFHNLWGLFPVSHSLWCNQGGLNLRPVVKKQMKKTHCALRQRKCEPGVRVQWVEHGPRMVEALPSLGLWPNGVGATAHHRNQKHL